MKIQVCDSSSQSSGQKKPLTNYTFQLRLKDKGKDNGAINVKTDTMGCFQLDEKYRGQQIGTQTQWITASEGATLAVNPKPTQAGSPSSSPISGTSKGKQKEDYSH